MISFGIIGFLVLLLIYLVLKHQAMQRELSQLKHTLKATDAQSRFALRTLVMLAGQLQHQYHFRLEELRKHALVSNDDYEVMHFIMNQVEYVVMQCCEHRATVEEAINKAVGRSTLTIEQVNQLIAKQPSEVRVPWCKNSIAGFITACHNLTSLQVKTANQESQAAETSNKSS